MYGEHTCERCFRGAQSHPEDCGTQEERCSHFPALCCPGCPCGSFEAAHPELAGADDR